MRTRRFWPVVAGSVGFGLFLIQSYPTSVAAQTQTAVALTGQVTSAEEGPMEGVLLRAKKAGSTITLTVVSDAQGRYRFPRAKLAPGQYRIQIRAVGYDLDSPGTVEIAAQGTITADLKLRRAQDLASQLTNAEWLESFPMQEQRNALSAGTQGCVACHTLERVVRSRYDANSFLPLLARMGAYANQAFPLKPQLTPRAAELLNEPPSDLRKRLAAILATVNLSSAPTWGYALKTLPRPTGKATQVIYTEYDLPSPTIQPHDVVVDSQGVVWFNDFGGQALHKLDAKTGEITEYKMPLLKPGVATGTLDVEFDKDENMWFSMMNQEAVAKFDRKTQTFQTWSLPAEGRNIRPRLTHTAPAGSHVDGNVWVRNAGEGGNHRLAVATGKWKSFDAGAGSGYGILADSKNNLFFLLFSGESIGRIDAKTGETRLLKIPLPNAGPRRGRIDSQDRLWFGAYRGNAIGMLDTRTERFQVWPLPTVWSWPYDATVDKNGDAWAGGMFNDRVQRLDTRTGEVIDYLLPRPTNIRRVFVENSGTSVRFWAGGNHSAYILKLEPLDVPARDAR